MANKMAKPKMAMDKAVREERLKLIDWTLNAMHQTENKSLSVAGFYLAISSAFFQELIKYSETEGIVSSLIVGTLGVMVVAVMRKYSQWKRHYLELVQKLNREMGFPRDDLPASLMWKVESRYIKVTNWPHVDTLVELIPRLITMISFAYLAFQLMCNPCRGHWFSP